MDNERQKGHQVINKHEPDLTEKTGKGYMGVYVK